MAVGGDSSVPDESELLAYARGELDTTRRAAVDAALDADPNALAIVAALLQVEDAGTEATTLGPGARLGRYSLGRRIGAGGMGVVFEAHDAELDRPVAIKVHRGDERLRARIAREAHALASLSHPNVVEIYDVGTTDQHTYIVMERLRGTTLARWCRDAPRTTDEIVSVLGAVARGLIAVHDAGLVHRDIKPSNVVVTDEGRVQIVDFGLASNTGPGSSGSGDSARPSNGAPITVAGEIAGTPSYMAPEQRAGCPCTPRSDQYSFCVAAHECLHGRRFDSRARRIRRVLRRGRRNDPKDRYDNLGELLDEMRTAATTRWPRRGLLVAVCAVGLGVYAGHRTETPECSSSDELWLDIWDPSHRAALHDAYAALGTTWAAPVHARLERDLDRYVSAWNEQHAEVCVEEPHARTSERLRCLRNSQTAARAVVDTLIGVPLEGAAHGARALDSLPDPRACADPSGLSGNPLRDAEADAILALVVEARTWQRTAQPHRALAAADALVARAALLDDSATSASVRQLRGTVLLDVGRYEAAYAELQEGLDAAALGGHARLAAELLNDQVMVLGHHLGQPENARLVARHAESWIHRAGDEPGLRVRWLLALGWTALDLAETQRAIEYLERASDVLDTTEVESAALLEDRAAVLNATGIAAGRLGDFDRAVECFEEAERLITEGLGSEHPDLAAPLINRAQVVRERKDYAGSIALLERARALIEATYGTHHPRLGEVESNLAVTELVRGREAAALAHADQAIALLEDARGQDHRSLVRTRALRAEARLRQGDVEEALDDYELSLRSMIVRYGDIHPMVADARLQAARALFRVGRYEAARVHYEQALQSLDEINGSTHPSLADPLVFLGQIDMIAGDRAAAVPKLARAALLVRGKLASYCHLRYGQALIEVGQLDRARRELEVAGELGQFRPDGALEAERRASLAQAEGLEQG